MKQSINAREAGAGGAAGVADRGDVTGEEETVDGAGGGDADMGCTRTQVEAELRRSQLFAERMRDALGQRDRKMVGLHTAVKPLLSHSSTEEFNNNN
eukprot:383302-Prorocentrum_minimum.AAC.2